MTTATIYYFSATGNCLAFARQLAQRTGAAPIPMTRVLAGEAVPAAGKVALVFPTYAYGVPRTVLEFLARVELQPGAYLLAVTSCAGIPAGVLRELDGALRRRGHRLAAGFVVRDPSSSLTTSERDPMQRVMIALTRGRLPGTSQERIEEIAAAFRDGAARRLEGSGRLANLAGRLFHRLSGLAFPTLDRNFWTTDACTGCGTCARLCPRGNIRLADGRPRWGGDCEVCHACIQWCARSAIQFKDLTAGRPRYRNGAVSLRLMLER